MVVRRVVESHQDIVDAVAAGDPKRAGECMAHHFEEAQRALATARSRKEHS